MLSVIKDFCIYAMGSALLRGMSALMAPLILRVIDPQQYGTLALISSIIALLTPLAGLGLRQVISIEYFHLDTRSRAQLVYIIIGVYLWCVTPIFILLYLLLHQPYWPIGNQLLLSLGLAIAFLHFFVELFYQLLRYEQRSMMLVLIQMMSALMTACFTLSCLYILHLGIAGILLAQLIALVIGTGFGIAYYIYTTRSMRIVYPRMTLSTIKYYVWYGLPFIPNTLFAWVLASGDRWMLARYATLHDVGIYALADMACQLFQLLILNAWAGAYLPYMLTRYAHQKAQILIIERTNLIYMVVCMIGCGLCILFGYGVCTPIMLWLLPVAYHGALPQIWILLLGQVFLLGSYFASTFIQFYKKRWFLSVGLCIPALINLILNYYLIPLFGLSGCTYATLAAYCIYFVITLCYNLFLQKQVSERIVYEGHDVAYTAATPAINHGVAHARHKPQEVAKL